MLIYTVLKEHLENLGVVAGLMPLEQVGWDLRGKLASLDFADHSVSHSKVQDELMNSSFYSADLCNEKHVSHKTNKQKKQTTV